MIALSFLPLPPSYPLVASLATTIYLLRVSHIERIIDRPAAVRWAGWRSRHSPVPRP